MALIVIADHPGGSYIACFSVLCTVKLSRLALRSHAGRAARASVTVGTGRAASVGFVRARTLSPRHEVDATGLEHRDLDGHRHLDQLCLG